MSNTVEYFLPAGLGGVYGALMGSAGEGGAAATGATRGQGGYVHVARVSNKAGAAFAVPGGPATSAAPAASNYFGGQSSTGFELGLRHDF